MSALSGGVAPTVFVGEVVERDFRVVREIQVDGGQCVGELVGAAGSEDRRGDGGVGEHPGDGQRGQRRPELGRGLGQPINGVECLGMPVAFVV